MIDLKQVSFGYRKTKEIFREMDLTLKPGSIYGLLGRNGAGKTSLLKMVNGLIFPQKGEVRVSGEDPAKRLPWNLADIYFVQEEPMIPSTTVLTYLYTYAPFYPNFDYDRFMRLLTSFGLEGSLRMDKMSHGQKKKVVLCFAVATNCKVLILDEPTNGLDIPAKSEFRRLVTEALTEERLIIISTHQVRDMNLLIDPILIVENGRVIFHYSIEQIGRALHFAQHFSMQVPQDVIYAERIAGGYLTISENTQGQDSDVDIEILFNAVQSHRERIVSLIEKYNSNSK
ncbi:MAG TPA: ABC transporter ATP-binding protein [Saprospiraceae bacterium]|nr:ABC transporter ATP-binding protein [Saprospiraceae bacterium]